MGGHGRTAAASDDLLTTEDVAARLAVSVRSVRRYADRGILTPIQLGRAVRYRATDVEGLIAARAATSGQSAADSLNGHGQPGADTSGGQERPQADHGLSGHADELEPIEAHYRVTPDEIERAVERTGAKYVADLQTMYQTISEDYRRLYEAQLAAKDEMIAELRRRAEIAERALALPEGSPVGIPTMKNGHGGAETTEPRLGLWRRLMGMLGA